MSSDQLLAKLKSNFSESELQKLFLGNTKVESSDPINPIAIRDVDSESSRPRLTTDKQVVDAPPDSRKPDQIQSLEPKTEFSFENTADALFPFRHFQVLRQNKKQYSFFIPNFLMLFHWIHIVNVELSKHFDFKRNTPTYHPFCLNIYFSILAYVQILRCNHFVARLSQNEHDFLVAFLSAYPPESLRIPGPLLPIFKAICCSQPENRSYGLVVPSTPQNYGPDLAREFTRDGQSDLFVPNVPVMISIFRLFIEGNSDTNPRPKNWTPWTGATLQPADATHPHPRWTLPGPNNTLIDFTLTINGYTFASTPHTWTHRAAWNLVSPGLAYPCESDRKHHATFAEYQVEYDLPYFGNDDDLSEIREFLGFDRTMHWFSTFRSVAAHAAATFNGSGSLADCSPFGPMANQVIIHYSTPTALPQRPNRMADPAGLFPIVFSGRTTSNTISQMHEIMAAASQINTRIFATHPYSPDFGGAGYRIGRFWDIRPIYNSAEDDESVYGLLETVQAMTINRPFK